MPKDIENAIKFNYKELCRRLGANDVFVAIRSSATAEDLPDASFAGQQETFLNVKGIEEVLEKTVRCWSSLFTPRAIFYRDQKGFAHEKVFISVGIQKMVNSKVAGVIFTINPVTGDPNQIVIEGNYGLGESVVSGAVTPDDFIVDKVTLKIIEKRIAKKDRAICPRPPNWKDRSHGGSFRKTRATMPDRPRNPYSCGTGQTYRTTLRKTSRHRMGD
jgi:pyruvate,water dikinase